MRVRPFGLALASTLAVFTVACAGTAPAPSTAVDAEAEEAASQEEARRQAEAQRRMESELALARAENERLRRRRSAAPPRETVRIGGGESLFDDPEAGAWSGTEQSYFEDPDAGQWEAPAPALRPRRDRARPVLRLHGDAAEPATAMELDLPLPPARGARALPPQAPASAPGTDAERSSYRAALALLEGRRVDAARRGFEAHLRAYPRGAYAARAAWWQAECLYALRAYAEALAAYRSFTRAHGAHPRAPEALWRASLCLVRMGRQP
ncbi:MAG: outer membrane protein assembly factor BamD, partial [Myxococcota bacterium]